MQKKNKKKKSVWDLIFQDEKKIPDRKPKVKTEKEKKEEDFLAMYCCGIFDDILK